ncbi:MAG: CdaR family protein [Firmicutes bacterium]|nr:CdaR family protein [Bacillota bacterium]
MMDRLLENDTALKIISVIVAIALWVTANSNRTPPTVATLGPIPLEWTTLPQGSDLMVMGLKPGAVTVQIKGPPTAVNAAHSSSLAAWVSLGQLTRPGTYSLPVHAAIPAGTSLVAVYPSRVVVTVDRVGRVKRAVTVRTIGTPDPGYLVASVNTSVPSAVLSGPSGDLAAVTEVVAEVPVAGRKASFSQQAILQPLNDEGRIVPHVEVNPVLATVSVTIKPQPPEVTLPVVVRYNGQPAAGYQIVSIGVEPSTVTVTGSAAALSGLTAVDTAPVDLSGARGPVAATVGLSLPPGVSPVAVNRVHVSIRIARSGAA